MNYVPNKPKCKLKKCKKITIFPSLQNVYIHKPHQSGGRQAAMSHHYLPFCTTTFDSSGQNYFFKWYI